MSISNLWIFDMLWSLLSIWKVFVLVFSNKFFGSIFTYICIFLFFSKVFPFVLFYEFLSLSFISNRLIMAKIHIIICLKITEKFLILTLTTQLHQKIRFSEFFFRILNMFAIVSNLQKKDLIFVKTHKINFLDPQTTNLNKTRRGHFWSSGRVRILRLYLVYLSEDN